MTTINNGITIPGNGLFAAQSREARFLRDAKSYSPDADPRMPLHTALGNTLYANSTVISLASVDSIEDPTGPTEFGAVRVKEEVILYSDVFTGNNSVKIFQRNVANTPFCNLTGAVNAGAVVSILGLRSL